MKKIPIKNQKIIIDALHKKGAKLPCPRCGNRAFMLAVNYIEQPNNMYDVKLICNNCGYLSIHSLAILGLDFKQEDKDDENI